MPSHSGGHNGILAMGVPEDAGPRWKTKFTVFFMMRKRRAVANQPRERLAPNSVWQRCMDTQTTAPWANKATCTSSGPKAGVLNATLLRPLKIIIDAFNRDGNLPRR